MEGTHSKKEETSEMPPERGKNPLQIIPVPLETSLRMTTAAFLGYALAYAGDRIGAIPSSQAFLVGLFASVISMRVPTNITVILGTVGLMYLVLFLGLAFTTALLAAATVSDGLFVAMMALWGLWISGLRYGPAQKLTGIFSSILVVFVGMFALGLYAVVRDGLEVKVSRELWTDLVGKYIESSVQEQSDTKENLVALVQSVLQERLAGTVASGTEELILFLQRLNLPAMSLTGTQGLLALAQGSLQNVREYSQEVHQAIQLLASVLQADKLCLPRNDGLFQGRSFCFTLTQEMELVLSTDGGMWLVKRLWTWSGVDNPLAVFQNLIVVASWSFLCVFVGALLPPWRTLRYELTRIELPLTLREAAWYMNRRCESHDKKLTQDEDRVRQHLIDAARTYHKGSVGAVTAFEPRLFDNFLSTPRCTWLVLKELAASVESVALHAIGVGHRALPAQSVDDIASCVESFKQSAVVLENNDLTTMETVDPQISQDSSLGQVNAENQSPGKSLLEEISHQTDNAAKRWLGELNPTRADPLSLNEGIQNIAKNVALWFAPSLAFLAQLGYVLMMPILLYKEKVEWDTSKWFQCVKFTCGFTALVCCSVYWGDYREYEVPLVHSSDPGYELVKGTKLSTFSGWNLIAYAFATMPTTEGTVKKCVLRLGGTCIGAFSAWALIKATGDSKYGSVVWLTVTAFPAVFASVERTPGLRQRSRSEDFGYGGFYFVLTQSVIVMEYLGGLGDGDDLVVNRLISNISGIFMAMVLSVIPPTVMGGDSRWAQKVLVEIMATLKLLAQLALDENVEEIEELLSSFSAKVDASQSDAWYLLEDAKRLSTFPLYKVSPVLEKELSTLYVTSTMLSFFMEVIIAHLKSGLEVDPALRNELESFLIGHDEANTDGSYTFKEEEGNISSDASIQGLVACAQALRTKIEEHKTILL